MSSSNKDIEQRRGGDETDAAAAVPENRAHVD